MEAFKTASLVMIAALAGVGSVYAGQPPDVVVSDGGSNTAMGTRALYNLGSGGENTAAGFYALPSNTSGYNNSAFGASALQANSTGSGNSAFGEVALLENTDGDGNTAVGNAAMYYNSASENTAVGYDALFNNTTGIDNTVIGYNAGINLTTGNYNIDIGNHGKAGDHATIRLGGADQTTAYIAGIYNNTLSGAEVVITSSGQLGVALSSERFKTDISSMPDTSAKLQQLRPVTFHYKTDPNGNLQYGLIAEEVAKVYPDLVIRDGSGRIDGVRYDELAPMLLNEVQQQAMEIRDLKQLQNQVVEQAAQLRDVQKQLADMQVAFVKLQPKGELVARR
jgi:hypothetical protein